MTAPLSIQESLYPELTCFDRLRIVVTSELTVDDKTRATMTASWAPISATRSTRVRGAG